MLKENNSPTVDGSVWVSQETPTFSNEIERRFFTGAHGSSIGAELCGVEEEVEGSSFKVHVHCCCCWRLVDFFFDSHKVGRGGSSKMDGLASSSDDALYLGVLPSGGEFSLSLSLSPKSVISKFRIGKCTGQAQTFWAKSFCSKSFMIENVDDKRIKVEQTSWSKCWKTNESKLDSKFVNGHKCFICLTRHPLITVEHNW